MYVIFYILYAVIQGILINRFYIKDTTAPGAIVVVMSLFAPLATVLVVGSVVFDGITWLATPREIK